MQSGNGANVAIVEKKFLNLSEYFLLFIFIKTGLSTLIKV